MSFQIKITEKKTVTKMVRGSWVILGQTPVTKKDLEECAFASEKFDSLLKEKRGYAPTREDDVEVEIEILKQTVEELDIAAVIRAVNKL